MSRMTGTWWWMEIPWMADAEAGATEKPLSDEESETPEWLEAGAIGAAEEDVA
jgi:hypothetical protein